MADRSLSFPLVAALTMLMLGAEAPSEPDQSGRDHPPLQATDQPLGDIGQWYVLDVVHTRSEAGVTLTKLEDGSILISGHDPDHDTVTAAVRTTLKGITALRLDALADESLPRDGPGRSSGGNFTLSRLAVELSPEDRPDARQPITLHPPESDYSQRGYDSVGAIDEDVATGWSIGTGGGDHWLIARTASPVGDGSPLLLTFTLEQRHPERKGYTLGRFRLCATTADPPPPADEPLLRPLQVGVGFVSVPITAFAAGSGAVGEPQPDGSLVITGGKPLNDSYTFELHTELEGVSAIQLEAVGDGASPSGPGRNSPNYAVSELFVEAAPKGKPDARVPVVLANPTSDYPSVGQPVEYAADGNEKTFWNVKGRGGETRAASFAFVTPVSHESGTVFFITLRQRLAIGRLRVSLTVAREERFIRLAPPERRGRAQPTPPPSPRVERYYNLGGHAFADPPGHQWLPVQRWREGRDGYLGGATLRAGTDYNHLTRTAITGIDAFRVQLPGGRYRVAMVFAEARPETEIGYRRFDVHVEGVRVLNGFDPVRQTGSVGAHYIHVLESVKVTDGRLDIDFTGEKPILNALAVTRVEDKRPR